MSALPSTADTCSALGYVRFGQLKADISQCAVMSTPTSSASQWEASRRGTIELQRIDEVVSNIRWPLTFSDQVYNLRSHIEIVRRRTTPRENLPIAAE